MAARKWALSTYTAKVGQSDRRSKAPTIQQFEDLAERPIGQSISLDEAFGPSPAFFSPSSVSSVGARPTPRVRRPRQSRAATP